MPQEHILVNDIISDHRERMLNLKKYYPFFKLTETSFSWFMDGQYDNILDMGYILMAVLRFFIEENNFKERDVTYSEYSSFMSECIKRDFGLQLYEEDSKALIDYIFDKLKNDGKPFSFQYFDPVDRKKKVSRVKLLESRITDGTVWYSISSDGIEFYLDTKEIKDESKISVEQLLLEKMIKSKDFKGGTEVIKRINREVERLWYKKNQVLDMLTVDIFAGIEAYEHFVQTGMKWFEDEQKLFIKNKELIEGALKKAENDKAEGDTASFYRTSNEIYELDTQLKVAMSNHSRLLKACTDLSIKADETIKKAKLNRLRTRFDFRNAMDTIIRKDNLTAVEEIVKPLFGLNIRKTFSLTSIEDMLTYRPERIETAELVKNVKAEDIVFEDELENERINDNCCTLMKVLLEYISSNERFTLKDFNDHICGIFGQEVFKNTDYYSFLVHLCQKKEYNITSAGDKVDTFLDGMIKEYMARPDFREFEGIRFKIDLADGNETVVSLGNGCEVTDFTITRL